MWLTFDHEKFEEAKAKGAEDSAFYGFLNIKVTNDNSSGDSEETVIIFDTGGHGGSHIRVETNDFPSGQDFTADKVVLTLYGGMEAGAFFSAMENLITSYKLRSTIGD
jgi:hypothetical protein